MSYHSSDQAAPARTWITITPHDSNNIPAGCRGIYVGGAGNVVLVGADGVAKTFTAVPVGTFMPCGPIRVNSTSTTATLLLGLY